MPLVTPATAEEMGECLRECGRAARSVNVLGNGSKHRFAGPVAEARVNLSTSRLTRVLQYEPNDLTVSVEAGMPWSSLQAMLARNRQMIALDPPFRARATVGGVIAANASGQLRRGFGTARDLVIGMQFAMLDGNLVNTGGMVVKNVAGLDLAKLLIGSFGTLAVITSVNFRLHAIPEATATFLFSFPDAESAFAKRDVILQSLLRPLAIDLLSPPAAARLGQRGYLLAIRAGGSPSLLARYERDLAAHQRLENGTDESFWTQVCEFPADFLGRQPGGIIVRVSTALSEMASVFKHLTGSCIARAASGVTYAYFSSWQGVEGLWAAAGQNRWTAFIEAGPQEIRATKELSLSHNPHYASTSQLTYQIKQLFDPEALLNRGRLYGRI